MFFSNCEHTISVEARILNTSKLFNTCDTENAAKEKQTMGSIDLGEGFCVLEIG